VLGGSATAEGGSGPRDARTEIDLDAGPTPRTGGKEPVDADLWDVIYE
jgi:hypothetical protein